MVLAFVADTRLECLRKSAVLYKLPGHSGSVNEVAFHPKEPIVGSGSSEKTIFLGELVLAS